MTQTKPDKLNGSSNRASPLKRRATTAASPRRRRDPATAITTQHQNALAAAIRAQAEMECEAIAFQTVQLAKRGHTRSLERIYDSLDIDGSTPIKLGPIATIDEIAVALRVVILAATDGRISPSDATRIASMLVELRQTIIDIDMPLQLAELRSDLNDA